jgi:sugar phosphate permease
MAMSSALTASSNTVGGYVSDRLRNPPLVIGGALGVLACTSALLAVVESVPLLLVVIAVNSVFLQFYFGALFVVPMETLGPRFAGSATGFANLFANIGGLTAAYALGVVKDHTGTFAWGFIGVSAVCLAGVALAVLLARMRGTAPRG